MNYFKPARFNDALRVAVAVHERGRVSLTFEQQVLHDNEGAITELCRGRVKIACLEAVAMRPCPIPDYIQTEIDGAI